MVKISSRQLNINSSLDLSDQAINKVDLLQLSKQGVAGLTGPFAGIAYTSDDYVTVGSNAVFDANNGFKIRGDALKNEITLAHLAGVTGLAGQPIVIGAGGNGVTTSPSAPVSIDGGGLGSVAYATKITMGTGLTLVPGAPGVYTLNASATGLVNIPVSISGGTGTTGNATSIVIGEGLSGVVGVGGALTLTNTVSGGGGGLSSIPVSGNGITGTAPVTSIAISTGLSGSFNVGTGALTLTNTVSGGGGGGGITGILATGTGSNLNNEYQTLNIGTGLSGSWVGGVLTLTNTVTATPPPNLSNYLQLGSTRNASLIVGLAFNLTSDGVYGFETANQASNTVGFNAIVVSGTAGYRAFSDNDFAAGGIGFTCEGELDYGVTIQSTVKKPIVLASQSFGARNATTNSGTIINVGGVLYFSNGTNWVSVFSGLVSGPTL